MSDWNMVVDLSGIEGVERELTVFDLTPLREAMQDAAAVIRDTWARAVMGTKLPGMTRAIHDEEYYQSLFMKDAITSDNVLHIAVGTSYEGADRIENGFASYDMKPQLLSGPSARKSKDGARYNTVPFRHMTPKPGGTGAGSAQDVRAHGQTMPASVYKVVKDQGVYHDPRSAALGQQLGQRSKVAGLINLQALAQGQKAPMAGNYTWKYGMYHNMRRYTKQYGKSTQSTYWTFRRVSDNSDPNSWINPGRAANPIIDSVVDATIDLVSEIIYRGALAAYGI